MDSNSLSRSSARPGPPQNTLGFVSLILGPSVAVLQAPTFPGLSVYTGAWGQVGRSRLRASSPSPRGGQTKPTGRAAGWQAVGQGRTAPRPAQRRKGPRETDFRKRGPVGAGPVPAFLQGEPGGGGPIRGQTRGSHWRRVSVWGSQHPSSKARQETALGKRKRKCLGSGSGGHGVWPGGVAGGGEESRAQSGVGPQPAPAARLPHSPGSQP